MVTGYTGSAYVNHVQVVDMTSNKPCANLQQYPISMNTASGGVVGGVPMICGGSGKASGESSFDKRKECYTYNKSSHAWKIHANLNVKRWGHSSVVVDDALWVLGGYNSGNLASTEYVRTDGTVAAGPNLPSPRSRHCSVVLTDARIIIIGGNQSDKSMLIFSQDDNSFTPGPTLIYDRDYAACTLFTSAKHGNRPVVLSAGGNGP